MSQKFITVCGTGDPLFQQEFPEKYLSGISPVANFINSCGLKITNLETNFSDFEYFAGAYSGGKKTGEILDLINDLSFRYAVKFRNDGGLFKLA